MDQVLEELEYEINILTNSGFYSKDEIKEIIEEQFIDENLKKYKLLDLINNSLVEYKESVKGKDSNYFNNLNNAFKQLTEKRIVCIHNAGFDFEEGVEDAMEIYIHLVNNNHNPRGFVFYSFIDIEESLNENLLYLSFGDYNKDENLALKIGEEIQEVLLENNLNVEWNHTINEEIIIKPFIWDKEYNNGIYEMEGAVKSYIEIN